MNEFITGSQNFEESPMCLKIKTYNNTGMDKDTYDYIFTGTEIDRPPPVTDSPPAGNDTTSR